jgi:membrane protease YdiL (CAAX protease family)
LPYELQRYPDENRFVTVDWPSFVLLFSVSFTLVPFLEEWLFRGVIFTGIYNSCGTGAAIFLSSVLFVAVHFRYFFYVSALPLFCIFFLSVVFGFVRSRANSLVPGIIIHAAYNFVAFFAGIKP